MSCVWVPKATAQAVLGSIILKSAIKIDDPEYIRYGQIIQTTAIFSIVICAPIGAILINTLGPKILPKDPDNETTDDSDGHSAQPAEEGIQP